MRRFEQRARDSRYFGFEPFSTGTFWLRLDLTVIHTLFYLFVAVFLHGPETVRNSESNRGWPGDASSHQPPLPTARVTLRRASCPSIPNSRSLAPRSRRHVVDGGARARGLPRGSRELREAPSPRRIPARRASASPARGRARVRAGSRAAHVVPSQALRIHQGPQSEAL